MSLCGCGCGQDSGVYTMTSFKAGKIKGHPRRFIWGHNGKFIMQSEKTRNKLSDTNKRFYKEGKLSYLTTKGLKRPDICGDNNPATITKAPNPITI